MALGDWVHFRDDNSAISIFAVLEMGGQKSQKLLPFAKMEGKCDVSISAPDKEE